ncbi:MAG: ABC transporter ATP-binding protein [Calditrichaeota bacterium]|nr:ABC transporter ATP-binding protein [Calditrichota bacterium]MCB0303118.1 ABC transporter ATP-binding protein [Calditrichota bacterium]
MIILKNISKTYHNGAVEVPVLQDISFSIDAGEFVTIMGPSGAGKSTLLHILGMLDIPSRGEYYFLDQPAHQFSEKMRTQFHREYIGFVFQRYHLIDALTVYENLETPLIYQKQKRHDRQGKVAEMLDRFQIVGKKDLFPRQLSGGQQQLVGIARALVIEPRLILADEPTGNLHTSQGKVVMDLFKRLNQEGVTIVQVTHSEANAAYGSRTLQLLDGCLVA